MNKKAQFTSFLVVFLIIVLGALAYTMYKYNKYEETLKLNKESTITFNLYGHVEKNKYYLEKAAEISKQKALLELKTNGGHLQGQCTKDLASGKIIWNSCPKLNLNEDFKIIFEKEFKKYIKSQSQPYNSIGYEYTTANFNAELEKIKSLDPAITISNNILNIKFKEIFYNIEYKNESKENNYFLIKYTFNPSISIKAPDISIYTKVCEVLISCNQITDCSNELKKLSNLDVKEKNNDILDLSHPILDFSVDLKSKISCQQGLTP